MAALEYYPHFNLSASTVALGYLVLLMIRERKDIFILEYGALDPLTPLLKAGFVVLVLQRTSTAMMFYLRVHAIYPSSSHRYLQGIFLFLIVDIAFSCVITPYFSGFVNGAFDLAIFFVIFWKLVWSNEDQTTIRSLFRFDTRGRITDRFLRDSLFYVLWVSDLIRQCNLKLTVMLGSQLSLRYLKWSFSEDLIIGSRSWWYWTQ